MSDTRARFYSRAFDIMDQVPLAKPVKEKDGSMRTTKKPNITDARKLGLLPSVTTILDDVLAKGQSLMDWQMDQVLNACIDLPFNREKTEEEIKAYKIMIVAKSEEYRNFTADRGKLLHALVSRWIASKVVPDDPAALKATGMIDSYLKGREIESVSTEEPLGSVVHGFAGTPDINIKTKSGREIIDIKTTSFKSFKKPYDSWKFQLAAYDILTESDPGTKLTQCVIDRDLGDCLFLEHERAEDWKKGFLSLFEVWTIINNYDPRKV